MLQFDETTTRLLENVYQGADITRRRRAAFDALRPRSGETIIDIGCGNALLSLELARAVGPAGRVIGVDPSVDMRAAGEARCSDFPSVSLVDGLADALPLADGEADKAAAVQVLEYLSDIPAAVREAHRALKPGGRFVAVDTAFDTLFWFSEDEARMGRIVEAWDHHYEEACVAALWPGLMRNAGFLVEEIRPVTFSDHTLKPDGLAFMLMHLMSRYAASNGHVTEAEAQAWFNEQERLAAEGRFFFSLTYFCLSGVKV